MSSHDVKNYYIAALHALRSASEQGAATAPLLAGKARDADLKAIIEDYGDTATRHQQQIVGFMDEVGVAPNGFKDRVMEGVGNGTSEMLKAATDDVIDLGVLSGTQTGAQYYWNAFVSQPPMAKAFGLGGQAARWAEMAEEWQAIEDRLGKVAAAVMAAAMEDERQPA